MTLRRMHERLGEMITENDRRWARLVATGENKGYDSINRNDREVMVAMKRGKRARDWYYPIKAVCSALCGVSVVGKDGEKVGMDIFEVMVDESEVCKPWKG